MVLAHGTFDGTVAHVADSRLKHQQPRRADEQAPPTAPSCTAVRHYSRVSTTVDQRSDRLGDVLDAARRVILRDGIDGLGAQSLADEAGTSVAMPYHYVSSLADVVCALCVREQGVAQTRRDIAQQAAGERPADQLRAVLAADFDGPLHAVRDAWSVRLEFQRRGIVDPRVLALVRKSEQAACAQLAAIVTACGAPSALSAESTAQRLLALSCGLGAMLLLDSIEAADALEQLSEAVEQLPRWRSAATTGEAAAVSANSRPAADDPVERIVDATIIEIAERGAGAVRFSSVADAAGTSHSLPRYYFSSRRELLEAAFARDTELAHARMLHSAAAIEDPVERLRYVYIGGSPEHLAALRPTLALWLEYLCFADRDPAAREPARRRLEGWIDYGVELGTELASVGHALADRITPSASRRQVAINTGAGMLWLAGALSDADYPSVVNGAIDDELGRGV